MSYVYELSDIVKYYCENMEESDFSTANVKLVKRNEGQSECFLSNLNAEEELTAYAQFTSEEAHQNYTVVLHNNNAQLQFASEVANAAASGSAELISGSSGVIGAIITGDCTITID